MNKRPITIGSCFSGIGGELVAASMMGWDVKFFCEKNPFGRRVLEYWYKNAKSYEDITTTDFSEWRGRIDVLTGGFPCQPFSYAGQRRGSEDDRYLWPSMFRAIDEVQPGWVVAENVAGILTMVEQGTVSDLGGAPTLFDEGDSVHRYEQRETFTIERICRDLESHGYEVQPVLIPACAVGAPHRRDRVFIVGRRIASDTNDGADGRAAGADEGACGQERLQERHEVRKPDEPDQVRRAGEGDASADPSDEGLQGRYNCDTQRHGESSDGCFRQPCEVSGLNGRERDAADTDHTRLERRDQSGSEEGGKRLHLWRHFAGHGNERSQEAGCGRWENFPSVSPVHRGNDGLPFPVDDLTIPFAKWRTESLKAFGNAIVPQVMYEIFMAIEKVYINMNDRQYRITAINRLTGERECISSPLTQGAACDAVKHIKGISPNKRPYIYPMIEKL